jgi:hypothetical protein
MPWPTRWWPAGVRRVTGRIVADDTRYDALRTVPSWPERYQRENQVGPLGALTVDDGFRLTCRPRAPTTPRCVDGWTTPPSTAAEQLNALLFARGVAVDGGVGRRTRPARRWRAGRHRFGAPG